MSKWERLAARIVKAEGREGRINLSFVDDQEIQALNKKFRRKDKPTDVLSFNMDEDGLIGDLIIAKETTRCNAKKYGVSYETEVRRLVVHGTLHLLGYDHGKEMSDAEKTYEKL